MSTPTIPEQIAALKLVKADPSWNAQTLSCLRATLALLTRLRDAEQAREPRKAPKRERLRGRGGMDVSFDY